MTQLECWRLRQDLAAYTSGTSRSLRDIGIAAAPAALVGIAKWLRWHGHNIDAASGEWIASLPASAARTVPTVPRVVDIATELLDSAMPLSRPGDVAAVGITERLLRAELEVANLRAVLEGRQ